jgi:signal transduction histidine kinase
MKKLLSLAGLLLCMLVPLAALPDEGRATPEQAKALVKKAIVFYKANGRDKALAEFARKDGQFIHQDLYINAYDLKGMCLSHINEKTIGKDMIDLRDPDGKLIIRERLERAQKDGSGWQEYKFFNPASKKVEPKMMYFEKYEDVVFAAGAYKPEKS